MTENQRIDTGSQERQLTPIEVGEKAPDFELPGFKEDGIEEFRLSDYLEEGPVILAFYPFDFSPVCADELCTFRDVEWLSFSADVDVWGISPDSAYSHREFSRSNDFEFPLLSDRLGNISGRFGLLLNEFEHHEAVPQRSIIAVDSNRTVRYRWIAEGQYQVPEVEILEDAIDWHRNGGSQ